ncbi:MAG: T9SS C-terminal target domain-containing protein, partial [Bacteroidia bacterium]|nr:T9SS C-terminal target domain-containing protein [Bacteroidia bacterium]
MKNKVRFLIFLLWGSGLVNIIQAKNYIPENDSTSGTGSNKSIRSMTAGCIPASGSFEIDLNNVRALIHTGGDMWWDLMDDPKYEIPKNSGKTALFCGSIWIGGTDVNGQLRLCALEFRSRGVDYWPGPLVVSGPNRANVTADVCVEYDRHFVIERDEVVKFRTWYNADAETRAKDFSGYSVPEIIQEWPAHGDVSQGYDYHLAPFFDNDGDDFYNYNNGDYPFYDLDGIVDCGTTRELRRVRLYGDKTLWWVYNDKGNIHTETGGAAIGMEIRAQYFAFSTNDELNNMTFGNYEIINRSTYTLENCYFGIWTDADMGLYSDDYVGTDVSKGLGYLYNGDEMDGDGNGNTYGKQPPAVGIDFFEGPYQDEDGKDNLSSWITEDKSVLDCEYGYARRNELGQPDINGEYQQVDVIDLTEGNINGLNFGDGRVDNERWGMRRFIYFNNSTGPMGDPTTAVQFYYYLRGYWKDGTRMQYGGTGHLSGGPEADFMFPV